jgi:hypothetical protein
MNIASRESWCALALISILAAGCGSDGPITSQPPPEVDGAAPVVTPDAASLTPDAPAGLEAAADSALDDAAEVGAGDGGAADGPLDGQPDPRACGGLGQTACAGAACAEGLCVSDANKCIEPGTPCGQMAGNCNSDGTCGAGSQVCGGTNQQCCGIGQPPQGAYCSAPGNTCVGNGGNRTCRACGDKGQPCCGDAPGTCRAGTCVGNGNNRMCQ